MGGDKDGRVSGGVKGWRGVKQMTLSIHDNSIHKSYNPRIDISCSTEGVKHSIFTSNTVIVMVQVMLLGWNSSNLGTLV